MTLTENNITLSSKALNREVACTLLIPSDMGIAEKPHLLLLNDGQELDNLQLKETFENLFNTNRLKPVVVAAIHAGEDRLLEYGTASQPDFKNRGSKAKAYTSFIIKELLPHISDATEIPEFETIALAGFSLGGLSAIDIAWHNPHIFDKVGVFSGSFWWRSKDLTEDYSPQDRIMHSIISNTSGKPELKFWLQTGTKDETADRNRNGIIDSIDDTIDLIKELEAKGYKRPDDIQYLEVVGGKHDVSTWSKAMPKFLCWAFAR